MSEETEVKKDIKWLNNEVEKRIEKIKTDEVSFAGSDLFDEGYIHGMKDVEAIANQLDEPEVLSRDWINDNKEIYLINDTYVNAVPEHKLRNLLVSKQEGVDQAYKDGYEKGKEHASGKEAEETETVASVMADYFGAAARLKEVLNMEVEELEE